MKSYRRYYNYRVLFLVAAIALIGAGIYALNRYAVANFGSVGHTSSTHAFVATDQRVGSMSGVPLAIPTKDLSFDVEYLGESVWSKPPEPRPVRTFQSAMTNFSLQLSWPDLASRKRIAMDFSESDKNWIVLGVILRDYT